MNIDQLGEIGSQKLKSVQFRLHQHYQELPGNPRKLRKIIEIAKKPKKTEGEPSELSKDRKKPKDMLRKEIILDHPMTKND